MTDKIIRHGKTEKDVLLALQSLDMEQIRDRLRLQDRPYWTEDRLKKAILRYKQFMFLCWKYGSNTPSLDVDAVWHAHILFTQKYREDCENSLGFFLEHTPGKPDDESMTAAFQEKFEITKARILEEFGPEGAWD